MQTILDVAEDAVVTGWTAFEPELEVVTGVVVIVDDAGIEIEAAADEVGVDVLVLGALEVELEVEFWLGVVVPDAESEAEADSLGPVGGIVMLLDAELDAPGLDVLVVLPVNAGFDV